MHYYKLFPALCILFVLISCSNGIEEGNTTAPPKNKTTDSGTISTQPVQQPTPAPAGNQAGLNPAHGQPGHRCDIEVGAPLNSKPTTQAVNPPPQQLTVNPAPTTPIPGSNQAGLNPAHGQPGHRCDIAVGAPLNSKPTQ